MKHHYKTRFPAANIPRWNEDVATDTFFCDTPAHDDGIPGHGGCTMLQLFTGTTSHLTEAFPMKSEKNIPQALAELLRKHGAPNNLKSDNAKAILGDATQEILRQYCIGSQYSEPHYQNQNPAERRIQDIKADVNKLMDCTNTPAPFWLLCTLFVIYLSNRTSLESLQGCTPLQRASGIVPDISSLLHYHWWQPVYYMDEDATFSYSKEKGGRWVGVAENVGDVLTWWVLTDDTQQVIARSVLRPVTSDDPNLRAEPPPGNGELDTETEMLPDEDSPRVPISSVQDLAPQLTSLPKFSPDELMERTFLFTTEDGQRIRSSIVKKIEDQDSQNHQNIKFLCKVGDDGAEEILTYKEICDLVEEQDQHDGEKVWTYKKITGHQGPLKANDPEYKGCSFNVKVLWEDDSETYEPLTTFIKDDPITAALYAKENNLLSLPGWKRLRRFAKNDKKLKRLVNQAIFKSERRAPIFQFGVQVPRNHKEAVWLDQKNGNSKWKEAEKKELLQLDEYNTFKDMGKGHEPSREYQKIRVHFVYAVKHDLRHKARLVAGGHLTDPTMDNAYSGVVTLRSMRLALVIGELNGLTPMVGDIGNAYLEATTKEKVYFVAGPEFGELEGHTLIIHKALYGLRTSGARFHEKLADTLRDMGFRPSFADPDLWLREQEDHYEYLCVYVDDIMFISKQPQAFFDTLVSKYKYILKGVGQPEYHLGGNFGRDPDGTLYWGATRYVEKMMDNYERMFGGPPKKMGCPMDKDDSPELDSSDLLDEEGIKKYQSLIGALQWCITLGRVDIAVAVMGLSSFRVAPRERHMKRAQRIYGYLRRYNDAAIRFRTNIPPLDEHFSMPEHDWMYSVYGDGINEEEDPNMPKAKGKPVRMFTMVDANLYHCKVTGRAATGVLHFVNQTLVEGYSKKQPTVETATYGSEFVAARTATDQIIDLRYTLRSMGVPIEGASWLLGDNRSVITSSTIPHSTLSKRHNALAYHRVRSAIAGKFLKFCYVPSKQNTADIMTKYLPASELWPHVMTLLFWKGETWK